MLKKSREVIKDGVKIVINQYESMNKNVYYKFFVSRKEIILSEAQIKEIISVLMEMIGDK